MKEGWARDHPEIDLDRPAIVRLLQPVCPAAAVTGFERVAGGLTNTNFKVTASGLPPMLLRLYQRDAATAGKEAAIAARIAASVPVARFLHFCEQDPVTGHPYAIVEWIEGERLDTVAAIERDSIALGRSVGRVLAAIHDIAFERRGFFAADLNVSEAIDLGRSGLIAYLRQCLVEGIGGARLGAELTAAVLSLAERRGELLDRWLEPPCLAHGDFNGPNILMRRGEGAGFEVAAILDWEFALSASPALDFGNLLRPPLGANATLVAAVADGYRDARGKLPPAWRSIARIADLFAWADVVSRPQTGAPVVADARRVVHDIIAAVEAC